MGEVAGLVARPATGLSSLRHSSMLPGVVSWSCMVRISAMQSQTFQVAGRANR